MKANSDKCQAIYYIGKEIQVAKKFLQLDTTIIKCIDKVTLLGVSIDLLVFRACI